MTPKSEKVALFAGTFNPFTIGHADIVARALKIFDRVIVAIGYNENKDLLGTAISDLQNRVENIAAFYASEPRVTVDAYSGLTAEYAAKKGVSALVRGVRSASDFDYEKSIADVNLNVLGIDTMILPCRPELAHISSSMVRELQHNGFDISQFLP